MENNTTFAAPIPEAFDALICDLCAQCLDELAVQGLLGVVGCIADAEFTTSVCVFEQDSQDMCLQAAYDWIQKAKTQPSSRENLEDVCFYIVCYPALVETVSGSYSEALMVEFAQADAACAFSAYIRYEHAGDDQNFVYDDPVAAGEVAHLLA